MEKRKISLKHKFVALLFMLSIANIHVSFASTEGDEELYTIEEKEMELDESVGHSNRDNGSDSDLGSCDAYDAIEIFRDFAKAHTLPGNLGLLEDSHNELIAAIGDINNGKSALIHGLRGGLFRKNKKGRYEEKVKYAEEHLTNNTNTQPALMGGIKFGGSWTKMPNIGRIKINSWISKKWLNKKWVFADFPGLSDKEPFILAGAQIVLRKIKKLRALLCVVDKKQLHKEITKDNIAQHKLTGLIEYLQELLKEPLTFCKPNLLLVVNKTGGAYEVANVKKILNQHLNSLRKINASYKRDGKTKKWYQYGEPMLKFLQIFLLNEDQIICINDLNDKKKFEVALGKIEKIETLLDSDDITMKLDTPYLQKLLKLAIGSNIRISNLNTTYQASKKELQEKHNRSTNKYSEDKQKYDKQNETKKKLLVIGTVFFCLCFVSICIQAAKLNNAKDPKKSELIRAGIRLGFTICCCYYFLLWIVAGLSPNRCPAPVGPPKAPSEADIRKHTLAILAKNNQKVVGNKRREEAFYYELSGLGEVLMADPVLQMYREAYEQKYKQPRRR